MPTRQELLHILTTLDTAGLDAALNILDALKGYDKERRLYAVWCARQVQHLMTDPRSLAALDVAERHAHGQATDEELNAAYDAASAAVNAAWSAAGAVTRAARGAISGRSYVAAWSAARAAAHVAAAHTAAHTAARNAQAAKLCETIELSLKQQEG